ncbi:MAG TPA: hypothetical protein VNV35_20075, partial [Puia sp.]|nr:hypothetical protein [Puia sp.]
RDRQAVMAETAKLGDAKVPEDVRRGSGPYGMNAEGSSNGESSKSVQAWASGADGGVGAQVAAAYREGFIEVYQVILRIAAGLAFTGALMAILFIKKGQI